MYNVFCLPKVYFLEEVSHLNLLVLDQSTRVCDVGSKVGEWTVLFDLIMRTGLDHYMV